MFFFFLVGPPFGGVMYQFGGKELPFLILAVVAIVDGCKYPSTPCTFYLQLL